MPYQATTILGDHAGVKIWTLNVKLCGGNCR